MPTPFAQPPYWILISDIAGQNNLQKFSDALPVVFDRRVAALELTITDNSKVAFSPMGEGSVNIEKGTGGKFYIMMRLNGPADSSSTSKSIDAVWVNGNQTKRGTVTKFSGHGFKFSLAENFPDPE